MKIYCLLTLLIWLNVPVWVLAETRSIYVGDIITLEITSPGLSVNELTERFHGFDIVDIKDGPGGYLLSLRTFETGDHRVLLGDKEIIINVSSTLDDIHREGIFEGEARVIKPGFSVPLRALFYIAAGIFVLSGGLILMGFFKKHKTSAISSRQLFLQRTAALSAENENFFVDLTYYFKEYLESMFQCRIIGKTSVEIINGLKEIQALKTVLHEIREWLTECDRFKFTGIKVSYAQRQNHYTKLLNLVEQIETQREGAA